MASENVFFQAYDPVTGAQPGGARRCKIWVPFVHTLVSARVAFSNVVATGDLTVSLRIAYRQDSAGGRKLGSDLDDDDLTPAGLTVASVYNWFSWVLAGDDLATYPAWTLYFITTTGTNAADRLDEPLLMVEVREA